MADLADVAARFSALLHAAGVPVTPERAGRFASAVTLAPPATNSELYWLGRVTLVGDPSHLPLFDAVFASVFEGIVDPADFRGDAPPPPPSSPRRAAPPPVSGGPTGDGSIPGQSRLGGDGQPSEQEALAALMSAEERLRHEDFARLTPEELTQLRALTITAPRRPSRRRVRHPRGGELDVRATLRRARRTGGEPLSPVWRRQRVRARRVVLICDISGSMEAYGRAYLQLLWAGVGSKGEAFVFATRLTRLTATLRGVSPDVALERAGRKAPDWSGGTRIGEALKAFNDRYGRRGVARGAVILILSDGWDTGDADLVAREMERLHRLAHRIVWVNPRKAASGYQPLAGGMAAALPHVDAFVSGHNLAALDEVLEVLAS